VDTDGNLFIGDSGNSAVREVTNDNDIKTVAGVIASSGFSGDGGAATAALLAHPADIAFDSAGNLFIADNANATVRDVNLNSTFPPTAVGSTSTTQNLVLHVAGTLTITGITVPLSQGGSAEYTVGSIGGAGCSMGSPIVDGGSGTDCMLPATFHPAHPGWRRVPLVVAATAFDVPKNFASGMSGVGLGPQIAFTPALITTVAGNGTLGSLGNSGPATVAEFNNPYGLAADYQGSLYISDNGNNVVRRVDGSSQVITAFAGDQTQGSSGNGIPAMSAELNGPHGLATDSADNVYISDAGNSLLRSVNAGSGLIATVAGTAASQGDSGDNGPATSAQLDQPFANAIDAASNIYIADSGNNVIRRVDAATGVITTVAGNGTAGYSGDLGPAIAAQLSRPLAVVLDAAGNLYISDASNNVIRKVTASTGVITTVAGVAGGGGFSGDGGPAVSALLHDPEGLALDSAGNLYITDSANNVVRAVNALTQIITTLAGNVASNASGYSGDLGPANAALLNHPVFPAVDSAGNLDITDNGNNVVRQIGGAPPLTFGSIAVNTPSPVQDLILTNSGTAALTLTALSVPAGYNLSGGGTTCNSTIVLAPAASCALGIEFLPTAAGVLNGTLTITDSQGTQAIPLSGTGTQAATTATLTLAPNPPVGGGNVTLIATITPNAHRFTAGHGHILVTTETPSPVRPRYRCFRRRHVSLSRICPAAGYSWTAVYTGNAASAASTSAPVVLTVASSVVTSTALAVAPAASVNDGTAVTLTATVISNSLPVYPGTVLFCDATAPRCDGAAVFATAQLTASGVASFKFFPGAGTYSIKAVYAGAGSNSAGASASAPQTLTVNPSVLYGTGSTLVATGLPGNYTLTGIVAGFGIVPPTGQVTFLNQTASTTLGVESLSPLPLGREFNQATGVPMSSAYWEATGDFNGDGIPDLVVVNNSYSGTVTVLLGSGDGTFNQNPPTYPVGSIPAICHRS
jgi:hypothetical protein